MANICYSAVVIDNRNKFNEVLDYVESDSRFKEFMLNNNVDFMGAAYWCNKCILRFETKWEPVFWIARHIAKVCPDFEYWWQETCCGIAGKSVYTNGKSKGSKKIECDITEKEMIDCLYYTDWEGVNWSMPLNKNTGIEITGGPRFPYNFKVTVEQYVGEYGTEDYKHLIIDTIYCSHMDLKNAIDHYQKLMAA